MRLRKVPLWPKWCLKKTAGLRRIDEYAFYKTGFTEIVLPDSVKTLGGYLFKDSKLETITFPDTLDTLNFTFDGCKTLKTVNLTGDGSGDFKLNGGVVYKILKDDAGTVIGESLPIILIQKPIPRLKFLRTL